jgi:hypothetical protein
MRRSIMGLSLFAAALLSGGCAGSGGANATVVAETDGPLPAAWVPSADARFVTIKRSTTWSLARSEDTDLIVIEQPIDNDSRLYWLVTYDSSAPLGQPIEVTTEGPGARGWVLEYLKGGSTHAVRTDGSLTLQQRTEGTVTAAVRLRARTGSPSTAQQVAPEITLARRVQCSVLIPEVIDTGELPLRSGVKHEPEKERDPELDSILRFFNLGGRDAEGLAF